MSQTLIQSRAPLRFQSATTCSASPGAVTHIAMRSMRATYDSMFVAASAGTPHGSRRPSGRIANHSGCVFAKRLP